MGTYFLDFNVTKIPAENDSRRLISYYQWVAVFLVFQSVLFYCPHLLWRSLNSKSGKNTNVFYVFNVPNTV